MWEVGAVNVSAAPDLTRLKAFLAALLALIAACAPAGGAATRQAAETAVAALTDPAKLATLKSERAANSRLLKSLYWLHAAQADGHSPADIIAAAQVKNNTAAQPRAPLVRDALLRNLDNAQKLGCLTPANLDLMRRGRSPVISRGPSAGEKAEVDHIVPRAHAPEIENEFANLELMPASLNRRKSDSIGRRQLDWARKVHASGLLSDESLAGCELQYLLGFAGPVLAVAAAVAAFLWTRRRRWLR